MSKNLMIYFDEEGVAKAYDDAYDITIHCESEEEQQKVIEQLKSLQWIPVTERLPEEPGVYTVTNSNYEVVRYTFSGSDTSREYWERCVKAWLPMPKPYVED